MVIQMVTGQVGEYAAGILESANALLYYGVRAALHEYVLAPLIGHTSQQTVQRHCIGGGVIGRNGLTVNVVAYR